MIKKSYVFVARAMLLSVVLTLRINADVKPIPKHAVAQVLSYCFPIDIHNPANVPGEPRLALGSSFFISDDGYLLTNFHVVADAKMLFIAHPLCPGKQYPVEVVGASPSIDVALLRLTDKGKAEFKKDLKLTTIQFLELGDSDKDVKEGSPIHLFGYPHGQANFKVAAGIISGREGDKIQSDVAMNPGNSGGPCIDPYTHKVIGVCCSGIPHFMSDGVGYLIPINDIKGVLKDMALKKLLRLPYWGARTANTTTDTLAYLGNPSTIEGVVVCEVFPKSLAEQFGLQQGDVIVEINGCSVSCSGYVYSPARNERDRLHDFVNRIEQDSKVTVTVYRKGAKQELTGTFSFERPFAINGYFAHYDPPLQWTRIGGLIITELTLNHIFMLKKAIDVNSSALLQYEKYDKRFEPRVHASCVLPGSSFYTHDLFGDGDVVIKEVNGVAVKTIEDVQQALDAGKDLPNIVLLTEGNKPIAISRATLCDEEAKLLELYPYLKPAISCDSN